MLLCAAPNLETGVAHDLLQPQSQPPQVLQWVLAVLFCSFGMLFIWIGSSRRSKGRLADVALLFTLMFMISCVGYLGMALGLGLLYEAVGVEVMTDITINPGNVITKPVVRPSHSRPKP
jgi:bacteriorhodopsin